MRTKTAELWAEQDKHPGDHHRLFGAVAEAVDAETVLYPGSWCDVAASFVWPSVTYVDKDRRAVRFFDDPGGVREIIAAVAGAPADPEVGFIRADYTEPLPLAADGFDLLVSLYAGPVSRHCTSYLRVGGALLANPSHGDVALASIDPRLELSGVVTPRGGGYRATTADLEQYLVPKKPVEITAELIERTGRGVAYTNQAFAYLFRRVR
ncbi:MAG: hypothetical protein RIE08_10910 [Acidimicrobiales bacterium]